MGSVLYLWPAVIWQPSLCPLTCTDVCCSCQSKALGKQQAASGQLGYGHLHKVCRGALSNRPQSSRYALKIEQSLQYFTQAWRATGCLRKQISLVSWYQMEVAWVGWGLGKLTSDGWGPDRVAISSTSASSKDSVKQGQKGAMTHKVKTRDLRDGVQHSPALRPVDFLRMGSVDEMIQKVTAL